MVPPTCMLGVTGPGTLAFGYVLPPDDAYYTLIRPVDCPYLCPTPPARGYRALAAHVWLYFSEPCEIPITISLVKADLTNPSCPRPSTSEFLCGGILYLVNDGGAIGDCIDILLPLTPDCDFSLPVFLKAEFGQGTCATGRPAFCSPATCTDCTQYNIYPGSPPGGDDLCQLLSPNGIHGAIMYVDVDCDFPVPTRTSNWGHLKTLYR